MNQYVVALLERAAIVLAAGDVKSRLMWALRDLVKRAGSQDGEKTASEMRLVTDIVLLGINEDIYFAFDWDRFAPKGEAVNLEAQLAGIEKELEHRLGDDTFVVWGKFVPWVARVVNTASFVRDRPRFNQRMEISNALKLFADLSTKKQEGLPSNDINHYKSFSQLIAAVNDAASKQKKEVYRDNEFVIWEVFSKPALVSMTPAGIWCVGRPDSQYYEQYTRGVKNPRFFVAINVNDENDRYLAFAADGTVTEVKNAQNNELSGDDGVVASLNDYFRREGLDWEGPSESIDADDWVERYFEHETVIIMVDRTDQDAHEYYYYPESAVYYKDMERAVHDIAFVSLRTLQNIATQITRDADEREIALDGDVEDALRRLIVSVWSNRQVSLAWLKENRPGIFEAPNDGMSLLHELSRVNLNGTFVVGSLRFKILPGTEKMPPDEKYFDYYRDDIRLEVTVR